jgi:hypothetical protein
MRLFRAILTKLSWILRTQRLVQQTKDFFRQNDHFSECAIRTPLSEIRRSACTLFACDLEGFPPSFLTAHWLRDPGRSDGQNPGMFGLWCPFRPRFLPADDPAWWLQHRPVHHSDRPDPSGVLVGGKRCL